MGLLKQNHVKYGLIMAGVTAFCLALMELTGQNQAFDNKSIVQLIFMYIAPFVVWYFGIRARRKELKNKLTFRQGVIEGFKISLVYAIVSPVIFMAYYLFINQQILHYVRTAYNLTGAADITVIAADMVVQFIAALIFGTIYGAIISSFLRKS